VGDESRCEHGRRIREACLNVAKLLPMPFVLATDGTKLHYESVGSGPALVLQTGGAGDGSMWRDAGYVEPLSSAYECILLDHRGHGQSDQPSRRESHSMPRYVDDIVELLDHLKVQRAGFWGYSQGGIIGLALAALHPERLTALVMTGAMETPDRELNASENIAGAEALRTHGWQPDIFQSQPGEKMPAWFQRHFDSTNPEMVALWLDCEAEWDTWSHLSSVTVPVQMFVGDLEDPEHLNDRAAEQMRYASVRRLDGLDHLDAFIRSDLVMPEAMAFLAQGSSQ
jgi:pimeloyl-ACP methyl ester carboxylesterase